MNSFISSRLYNNETFYVAFTSDLRNAKRSVIIESPFITAKRMNGMTLILRGLRRAGVSIIVNTRNPDEHDAEYAAQAVRAISTMQDMGFTVLYTVKHHRKLAIIDGELLWEGSLNILSQNDSCEIMRRIDSVPLALQMMKFIGVDRYL